MLDRRWLRLVVGATLLDVAISPLFVWNVLAGDFARRLRLDPTSLASVFSVGLAAFAAGALVGGRLADRVSPRRLAMGIALVASAALLGSAAADGLPQLVASFGLGLGACTGIGYATAVRAAGTVDRRRGLTLGLVVSAYAAGTIVVAPLTAALLAGIGPAGTLVALAAATGAVVLAAAALLPDAVAGRQRPEAEGGGRAGPGRRAPVLSRSVLALGAAFGLGSAPGLAAFGHAGQIAGPRDVAPLAVLTLSLGNLAGRLIAGPAADRVGRRLGLQANVAALAGVCAALMPAEPPPLRLALLLVLGAQYGALSVLVPAALAGAVAPDRFGASYGVVFAGWGVAGLLAPTLAAWLALHAGWPATFGALLAAGALAWAALAAAGLERRPAQAGRTALP
jgi:OFA family oxalate/formate antiporter-like MFS transporter